MARSKDYGEVENFDAPKFVAKQAHVVQYDYLDSLLSRYTPIRTQKDYYLRPVPKKVGQVQLTIVRDNSFGSMTTTYSLRLSANDT